MGNDFTCTSKKAAVSALNAIIDGLPHGTQKAALKAVAEWVGKAFHDPIPESHEERRTLIAKIKKDMRACMSGEEALQEVAFLSEDIGQFHPTGKTGETLRKLKKWVDENIAPELLPGNIEEE